MSNRLDLTLSIVLYKTNINTITEAINSVKKSVLTYKLYLLDNSPTDTLKVLHKPEQDIHYIFTGRNLGFGKAHNFAMKKALKESDYHVVINPDISFDAGCLEKLFEYMEQNQGVGQVMPKVLYPDGEIQYLCKLLPSPADLFLRRFLPWFPGAQKRNNIYELRGSGYGKIMNIPYLSGCFMFFRTSSLEKVGLFDERIFMYIEDADLTRRMHQQFKTIYYPFVEIVHHYEKGSYKKFKLMLYNIHGAFVYFTKWGWFFDAERSRINKAVKRDSL